MTVSAPFDLLLLAILIPLIIYIGFPRVRFRRARDSVSLLIRITLVTLVVLALAGVLVYRWRAGSLGLRLRGSQSMAVAVRWKRPAGRKSSKPISLDSACSS